MNKLLKQILLNFRKLPLLIESRFDKEFLAPDVPMSRLLAIKNGQDTYTKSATNRA